MDEYGDEAVQNLHFFYDAQPRPAFVEYNGAKYRYLHNLQGDIIGIVDNNGNLVVEYRYDAWGKPILTTGTLKTSLGELNPFRYRGYVYDEETELYYLRSRYYAAYTGRFIVADVIFTQTPNNVFNYTRCNPVNYTDDNGKLPEYTNVVIYLQIDGPHWQIELFDTVFSFGVEGYRIINPKEVTGYLKITITDVPYAVAIKGLEYIRMETLPNSDDSYKSKESLSDWYGNTSKSDKYDLIEQPCAYLVDGVLKSMGILLDALVGSMLNKNYDSSKKRTSENIGYSKYIASNDYIKKYKLSGDLVFKWDTIRKIFEK